MGDKHAGEAGDHANFHDSKLGMNLESQEGAKEAQLSVEGRPVTNSP
jgi:hypothetical protein